MNTTLKTAATILLVTSVASLSSCDPAADSTASLNDGSNNSINNSKIAMATIAPASDNATDAKAKPAGCGMEECKMADGSIGCSMTGKQEIAECDKAACPKTVALTEEALDSWNHYGTAEKINRAPIGIDFLDKQKETAVTVTGNILNVCEKKGCWLEIAGENGQNPVRVTFKNYAFFVPRNSKGHKAVISGQAKLVTRDVEYLRHIAEDQGKAPEKIAKITEPLQQLEIIADKVYIQGDDLEKPFIP